MLANTEPEKFIQTENTFAGSAATALPSTPTASAPAMPPFCIPTSIAIVLAERLAAKNLENRPFSPHDQYRPRRIIGEIERAAIRRK